MFASQIIILLLLSVLISEGISKAPIDSSIIFSRGEGGYYCHKIPYLLVVKNNVNNLEDNNYTIIAMAEGRGKDGRNTCDDFAGTDLVMKRSEDGGNTWSNLTVFYSNSSDISTNVIGNIAPVQDLITNRIFFPFCKNNELVYISYSDDNGKTFSEPKYYEHLSNKFNGWKWIGLGPPGSIQLFNYKDKNTNKIVNRLLIPSYHTNKIKGDGCISKGHTIYSDDHGETWNIGSNSFGEPYLSNECQAVELNTGDILVAARTLTSHRIQITSKDGGITFEEPVVVNKDYLQQTLEGCEGSIIRDNLDKSHNNVLYFSNPNNDLVIRRNMTIFKSIDDGNTWQVFNNVDRGAVSYSSLQILPPLHEKDSRKLLLLYERSDSMEIVFDPDQIVLYKIPLE